MASDERCAVSSTLFTCSAALLIWPSVGFLAISSKYVLRYRDNHLWNPTNFAISALLLLAPDKVSVLSHQFGNELPTNLVIWTFGLIIAARVGVLHITLTYVLSFLLLNGARALGLAGEIGSLVAGKAADVICVDLSGAEHHPMLDPVSQLVYAASRHDVTDVWVAGEQLVADRALLRLDTADVCAAAERWARRLRG